MTSLKDEYNDTFEAIIKLDNHIVFYNGNTEYQISMSLTPGGETAHRVRWTEKTDLPTGYKSSFNTVAAGKTGLSLVQYYLPSEANVFISFKITHLNNQKNMARGVYLFTGSKSNWQAVAFKIVPTGKTGGPFNVDLYNFIVPGSGPPNRDLYLYARPAAESHYELVLVDFKTKKNNSQRALFGFRRRD